MLPIVRRILAAVTVLLHHGSSVRTSRHIRACIAACGSANGPPTAQDGFLFMRCSVIAGTKHVPSTAATNKSKTLEGMLKRVVLSDTNSTTCAQGRLFCHKNEGVRGHRSESKTPHLLIVPWWSTKQHWYQINLDSKDIQTFHFPPTRLYSIVYLQRDSRFLIGLLPDVRSVQLHKRTKFVLVKRIKRTMFMQADQEADLIFLSQRHALDCKISKMKPNGEKFKLILTFRSGDSLFSRIALDSRHRLLYIAGDTLFRVNYDGEEMKTFFQNSAGLDFVTIDQDLSVVYFANIADCTLKKMSVNGQISEVLSLKKIQADCKVGLWEVYSNVLYMSSFPRGDTLYSVEQLEQPYVKKYKFLEQGHMRTLLCLMC